MSKADIVAKALADIQAGQQQVVADAVGAACDASADAQKASDGTYTQADVDAKVAQAVSDAQAVDAQALTDAHASATAAQADLQAKLDAVTAQDKVDAAQAALVSNLGNSVAAMKTALAAIEALIPIPAQA